VCQRKNNPDAFDLVAADILYRVAETAVHAQA
jgi:hypothetical protein